MSMVIFGGNGFIGTALREIFDQQEIPYIYPLVKEINLAHHDSRNSVAKIVSHGDTVIMIAALTAEHGEAYQLIDMNIRMAANVIAGLEDRDIAHCVYISSDSVYGEPYETIKESTLMLPKTLYGHMHVIREKIFKERFPNLTIIRPCAIYGAGDTHNAYGINQFIRSALKYKEIILFGEGEECRSNVHIDDVAAIVAKAANEKISGIFNVNCGMAYSFKGIAEIIKANMESEIHIGSKPRTAPINHRYVDNSMLINTFLSPRSAPIGIKQMIEDLT